MGARAGRDGLVRSDGFPCIKGKSETPPDFSLEEKTLPLPRGTRARHFARDRSADVRILAALNELSREVERGVVSRMWWKLPSSGLRACNDGSSQAARSRDIGSRGWDRVSQPSTFRIWI